MIEFNGKARLYVWVKIPKTAQAAFESDTDILEGDLTVGEGAGYIFFWKRFQALVLFEAVEYVGISSPLRWATARPMCRRR